MKKILSVLLVILFIFNLCYCERSNAINNDKQKIIKIGMVTDLGGINDQAFNQMSWEGLKNLEKKRADVKVSFLESKSESDYYPNMELFLDNDYDLIFCVGFGQVETVKEVAKENPKSHFVIVDEGSIDMPNVADLVFAQEQSSFLVGVVAAMMTKTNKIGYVQGALANNMNKFGVGYIAGAKYINENIKVLQYNANSFSDPSIGSAAVTGMIAQNADVIFQAAGATGAGVISACQENHIYAIGADCDQSYLAPNTVITSALKKVDKVVEHTAEAFCNGKFIPGINYFDLKNNGVDIAYTKLLPQNVIDKVNEVKEEIKSGKIIVPSNSKEEKDFILDK